MAKKTEKPIRAAGGLIWDDQGRIAVIHRPRYDDWTLPKGKLDPGEGWKEAALREVWEETGCRCRIESFAGCAIYLAQGRRKLVAYWHMRIEKPGPLPAGDEVDELRWCEFEEAFDLLTRDNEREILSREYFRRFHA